MFKFYSQGKESVIFDYAYYPIEDIDSPDFTPFDISYDVSIHKSITTEDFGFYENGLNDFIKNEGVFYPLHDFACSVDDLRKNILTMVLSLKRGNEKFCTKEERNVIVCSSGKENDLFKLVFKFHYNEDGSCFGEVDILTFLDEDELEEKNIFFEYIIIDDEKQIKISKGDFKTSFRLSGKFPKESFLNFWFFSILEIFRIVCYDESEGF